MAVRDMATHVDQVYNDLIVISSTTPVNGPVVDTEGFDLGVTFFFAVTAYTSGDASVVIQEGDLADGSDMANVPNEKIVGFNQGSVPSVSLGAVTADNTNFEKLGVHSTKRYVRARLTGANTPSLTALITVLRGGEVLPVGDDT